MLTHAQFVAELKQGNKHIYLGGPSRVRTQSSALALTNAVQAFQNTPNGANFLRVHTEIHNLPNDKKMTYAHALRQLQTSMPAAVYVTPNPFTVNLNMVPGIAAARDPAGSNHQTDVLMALQQLHAVPAGAALMQAIVQRINASGKRVGITAWDGQQTNKCAVAGEGDAAKSELSHALEFNHPGVGQAINNALQTLGQVGMNRFTWLQNQLDACPIYTLVGVPNLIPSSTTYGAGWISAATLQAWCAGTATFPNPLIGAQRIQDAQVVIGAVLGRAARPHAGQHSRVNWSASSTQFTDTTNVVRVRPPYLALAHELIHAYHNICGDQAGHEIGTYSRVLYEYQCVGLGPWAGLPHTENAIRASIPFALRQCY